MRTFVMIVVVATAGLLGMVDRPQAVQGISASAITTPPTGLRRIGTWVGLDTATIVANKNLDPLIAKLKANKLTPHHKVADIPRFIDTFYLMLGSPMLHDMANPGENWQATDVVMEKLPSRMLDCFWMGKDIAVLTYETGGIGTSSHIAILTFDKRHVITSFWCGGTLGDVSTQKNIIHILIQQRDKPNWIRM